MADYEVEITYSRPGYQGGDFCFSGTVDMEAPRIKGFIPLKNGVCVKYVNLSKVRELKLPSHFIANCSEYISTLK